MDDEKPLSTEKNLPETQQREFQIVGSCWSGTFYHPDVFLLPNKQLQALEEKQSIQRRLK